MRPAINLAGRSFGRLRVLTREGSTTTTPRRPLWRCRCTCGRESVVAAASLLAGSTRSCGCLRVEIARKQLPAARAQLRSKRLANGRRRRRRSDRPLQLELTTHSAGDAQ